MAAAAALPQGLLVLLVLSILRQGGLPFVARTVRCRPWLRQAAVAGGPRKLGLQPPQRSPMPSEGVSVGRVRVVSDFWFGWRLVEGERKGTFGGLD